MPSKNRRSTPPKRGGNKKSTGFRIVWIVLIALVGLGVWLYFNQSEEPRGKITKESTKKRALEMLKDHPSAEVFDVQEDKKKRP